MANEQFAAQEEKRQKNERHHQQQKHETQMRDLQTQCEANVRELQQLQVHTWANPRRDSALFLENGYFGIKTKVIVSSVCFRMRSVICWLSMRPRSWRSWMRSTAQSSRTGERNSDPARRYHLLLLTLELNPSHSSEWLNYYTCVILVNTLFTRLSHTEWMYNDGLWKYLM